MILGVLLMNSLAYDHVSGLVQPNLSAEHREFNSVFSLFPPLPQDDSGVLAPNQE